MLLTYRRVAERSLVSKATDLSIAALPVLPRGLWVHVG
jgi:hypothetical protein